MATKGDEALSQVVDSFSCTVYDMRSCDTISCPVDIRVLKFINSPVREWNSVF